MVFSAGYLLGQLVGGWLADRYGPRRTLLIGGALSIASTALLVAHLPVMVIMLLQLVNGFGQGFGWPAVMRLLSVWLPRSQFALGIAWWSTSYALGSFLATSVATGLSTIETISISTGSRLSILVPCGILLLTTVLFFVRAKDQPSDAEATSQSGIGFSAVVTTSLNWKPILQNPEVQLLAVMYFFLKLTRYALLFWLPLYIIETQHARGNSALTLSSLFELTGFLGALIASYASDRWFNRRRYPVGAIMVFLAAFVFLLHPVVSSWGSIWTGFSISLIGILIFGPDVLMASVAVLEAVPQEQAGRASGYVNAVGSLGQMVSPCPCGVFHSHVWLE
jgi:sugar phosphate permease